MTGEITKEASVSAYQPPEDVRIFTNSVRKDYDYGVEILNRTWTELNDRSIIEDQNRGQMMFNAFVDTSVEDPREAWKWRGTRSMARNKGIALHANLTASYLLPLFIAQNDKDEVDRDFSEVMRDIIEWMAEPTNSNYQSSFLQVVFGMMTNPVTYLSAEYCEVFQTIRSKQEDGKYTKKEIIDEVLSGFRAPIYSASQILITNPYERNIQKQRRIIKRRFVEKEELEAKYGDHPNWAYVQSGIRSLYNDQDGLFYDIKDDNNTPLSIVAEETALSRRDDSEVCFVNGIYLGAANIEDNPIKHRDNNDAPKYNVTPFGYSRIGEHFFYYKSMMNCLGWDNMLYDAMSEVVMNRALLEVEMPIMISGSEKIDSDVIFPNSVVTNENENAKIQQLLPNSNMVAGFNALQDTEKSMNQGSVSETISGQLPDASQKAYSVANAQANSKKLIGAVGKSLGESVIQFGDLMKDIAINHLTIPQIDELSGDAGRLKYRSFLLDNKGGRMKNKNIKFDDSLIGAEMTDKEKKMERLKLVEDSGYPDNKGSLIRVNPELFSKFKYYTKVDVEEMFTKNQEYWQPILSQLYTLLANNPLVDQEVLLKKLMYSYFQSDADDVIKKQPVMPAQPAQDMSQGGKPKANQFGQQVNSKLLGQAAAGVVT